MKFVLAILFFSIILIDTYAQNEQNNPLAELSFYIGTWRLASEDTFIKERPQLKDLRVIDMKWGTDKRIIHSRTGIYTPTDTTLFSEGIITCNPSTDKIIWIEFQIDGPFLFEGEYKILARNKVQREYQVHYPIDYQSIPHPEIEGWTRLYRETLIPIAENEINWITEIFIGGDWMPASNGGENKAVRDL